MSTTDIDKDVFEAGKDAAGKPMEQAANLLDTAGARSDEAIGAASQLADQAVDRGNDAVAANAEVVAEAVAGTIEGTVVAGQVMAATMGAAVIGAATAAVQSLVAPGVIAGAVAGETGLPPQSDAAAGSEGPDDDEQDATAELTEGMSRAGQEAGAVTDDNAEEDESSDADRAHEGRPASGNAAP